MKLTDLAQVVGENLLAHRLRAVLTVLGITIGIAAVIAVVAIGQGGQEVIISQLEALGSSRYFEVTVDVIRGEAPTADTFRLQDAALIKELSPAVEKMAPLTYGSMIDVRRPQSKQKPLLSQLYGTTPDMTAALNLDIEEGRFLSTTDVTAHARVAVLDASLAEELFPQADALGKRIFIQDVPATVVGVMKKAPSSIMSMANLKTVYVPITFAQEILNSKVIFQLCGVAVTKEAIPQAIEDSVRILEKRHSGAGVNYIGQSLEQQLEVVAQVTSVMTVIIGAIAGIALLVGGVGVMNIMLVAVTERTREIGLLKALGASRRDILAQFLGEAIALCLVGGILGVVFGAGGAALIAFFAHWPPLISFWTILLAFGFSVAVGLFFGLYPASQAAALSPAEALRQL